MAKKVEKKYCNKNEIYEFFNNLHDWNNLSKIHEKDGNLVITLPKKAEIGNVSFQCMDFIKEDDDKYEYRVFKNIPSEYNEALLYTHWTDADHNDYRTMAMNN